MQQDFRLPTTSQPDPTLDFEPFNPDTLPASLPTSPSQFAVHDSLTFNDQPVLSDVADLHIRDSPNYRMQDWADSLLIIAPSQTENDARDSWDFNFKRLNSRTAHPLRHR